MQTIKEVRKHNIGFAKITFECSADPDASG
jgi:hypothetical protein